MFWLNLDQVLGIENNNSPADSSSNQNSQSSQADLSNPKPAKRWGQASVTAYNRLYIIGGYEGKKFA
jgi:hypothetical protein